MWIAWTLLACKPPLDGAAPLNTLETEDQLRLCGEYAIQASLAQSCSVIDVSVEPLEAETCVDHWMPRGCTATVQDWRDCQTAIAEDPCALIERHSACRPMEECGVHLWAAGLGVDPDVELEELAQDEIDGICAAGNDFDPKEVQCVDFLQPSSFEPDEEGCRTTLRDATCGTIRDYLDCQVEILEDPEAPVCRLQFPEPCRKLVCL